VIGDSLIHDFSSKDEVTAIVKCLPGAKVTTVTDFLQSCSDHYGHMYIMVGTNDCGGKQDVSKILED
jgi:hypothetical protein